MAFNIMAESSGKLNYNKIHEKVVMGELPFDVVPMPGLGVNGGDALGICVPFKNANESTWQQLKPVLLILKSQFSCDVYDMYGGQKLGSFNINTFKTNLLSE
jgi:hypothetical protein